MNGNGNGWLKLVVGALFALIVGSYGYTRTEVSHLEDNIYQRLERIERLLDELVQRR